MEVPELEAILPATQRPLPGPDGVRLVLVVDDDADIRHFVEVNLKLDGLEVCMVARGEEAIEKATILMPDAVLLDIGLPDIDGLEVCRRLRRLPKTRHIPIIFVTARALAQERFQGFAAGGDDYIEKPFDSKELLLRVHLAMDRARAMRGVSPLTNLPGNVQLQQEIQRVVNSSQRFALLHIDLDSFKAYNDHYGFLRGDDVLQLAGESISRCVEARTTQAFVGHIGGDDFIAIVPAEVAEDLAQDVIKQWDRISGALYDPEDLRRGYIELLDRQGHLRRFPRMTVSIGIATNALRRIESHGEAAAIAAEMKNVAKREARSSYAIDRRSD